MGLTPVVVVFGGLVVAAGRVGERLHPSGEGGRVEDGGDVEWEGDSGFGAYPLAGDGVDLFG
ncbi:hypothetical protein GCM10027605_22190 [Micromonospora zhanjiangensis]